MNPRLVLAVACLATPALAQQRAPYTRAVGPVRDAGVYHVATGTWTRGATSSVSPDAIYRNDAPSGYFGTGWEGCWTIEEAVLPGPSHPRQGSQDAYRVDGFDFSYCKVGAGTVDWYFGWYSSYTPCDDPLSPAHCVAPVPGIVQIPGLPGGNACWTLTVDLTGGFEVCLAADGGPCAPGYQGQGLQQDQMGLAFGWTTTDGGMAGPMLHGDPDWMPAGDGTCYQPTFGNACGASVATGLGSLDLFFFGNADDPSLPFTGCSIYPGCHWFGGYKNTKGCGSSHQSPMASFPFVLYADCATSCVPADSPYVYCDEAQNPANTGDIWINTTKVSPQISNLVTLTNGPPGQFCTLLVGDGNQTVSAPPGAVGDLCVAGGACLGRYDKDVGPIDALGTFTVDLQSAKSSPCGGGVKIAPGTTWNFQYWHRQPMGQPATFSSALNVTFQ